MNWREPLGIRGTRREGRKYVATARFGPLHGRFVKPVVERPLRIARAAVFWEANRVGADAEPHAMVIYKGLARSAGWTELLGPP